MPEQNPNVLHQPKVGPQQEVTPEAAYLAAVTSLPRILSDIGKVLTGIYEEQQEVNAKLEVIALYHERKGTDEKLFGPDDFPGPDEEIEGEGNEPGSE